MIADVGIVFGRVMFVMMFVLNLGGLLTWVERKQSAIMQDRIGANRASILGLRLFGLFHPLADAIKMLAKEDFRPARADRFLFSLAPFDGHVHLCGSPLYHTAVLNFAANSVTLRHPVVLMDRWD